MDDNIKKEVEELFGNSSTIIHNTKILIKLFRDKEISAGIDVATGKFFYPHLNEKPYLHFEKYKGIDAFNVSYVNFDEGDLTDKAIDNLDKSIDYFFRF